MVLSAPRRRIVFTDAGLVSVCRSSLAGTVKDKV